MCLGPEIALVAQIIGTAAAVGGTAYSVVKGQEASAASQRAEALRKRQMQNEANQRRRAAIREFQLRRATAVSNISGATGSLEGSAYGGSIAASTSTLGTAIGEINQAESIGAGIFDANADYSQASASAQTGAALGNFGKDLFSSGPEIGRIGATIFNQR